MPKYVNLILLPVIVIAVGFYLYNKSEQDAFNHCVDHAEPLRLAIIDYKKINADFPENLNQIDESLWCGKRLFRQPLIRYEKLDGDFLLSFSDKLITFKGSAEEPMTAFK